MRVVDVRQKGSTKTRIGLARSGQSWTAGFGEQMSEPAADDIGIVAVTAGTRRRADGIVNMAEPGAKSRTFEEQGVIELLNEASEVFEGNGLAVDALCGCGLDVVERVLTVEQTQPGHFARRHAEAALRQTQLVPDDVPSSTLRRRRQMRT